MTKSAMIIFGSSDQAMVSPDGDRSSKPVFVGAMTRDEFRRLTPHPRRIRFKQISVTRAVLMSTDDGVTSTNVDIDSESIIRCGIKGDEFCFLVPGAVLATKDEGGS